MKIKMKKEVKKQIQHYYTRIQIMEFKPFKIKESLRKKDFGFYSAPGVFSARRIDKGTKILIDNCIVKDGWDVLDMGCGIGVVGIVLSKIFRLNVTYVDTNLRALKLTAMNLKLHNLKGKVVESYLYERLKNKRFDTILCNPPQTAGKKVCFEIIEKARQHLNKNGLLQIVARHKKGGKHLSEKMFEVFGNMRIIAKKSGYRVYVSENKEE